MEIVALIGNGPSIVYNNELSIPSLTTGIVDAYTQLAGSEAGEALVGFANAVAGNDRDDFEGLLGPIDLLTQALPILAGMGGPLANIPWVTQPLNEATSALVRLHALGLGTALHLIAARSHGQGDDKLQLGHGALADELIGLANGQGLTLATLNYDGLLQAVLPDDLYADLASGEGQGERNLGDGTKLMSWPLRTAADFPPDRPINLIHLHGSLGWLRRGAEVRKFRIDELREVNLWSRFAVQEITVTPTVVLTDRKDNVPGTQPFSLGYKVFSDRLFTSRQWCIAGYSLLDTPVNRALADAARARKNAGLPEPRVLVLGFGDADQLKAHALNVLENQTQSVFADGAGIPDCIGGDAWTEWASARRNMARA